MNIESRRKPKLNSYIRAGMQILSTVLLTNLLAATWVDDDLAIYLTNIPISVF